MAAVTVTAALILLVSVIGLLILAIPFRDMDDLDPYWDDEDL